MKENESYQSRHNRIDSAFKRQIPDRVPFVLNVCSWAIQYYGYNVRDVYCDKPELAFDVYSKFADEFKIDAFIQYSSGAAPIVATEPLGGGHYRVDERSGLQVSNLTCLLMNPDEYELLEKDFITFLRDVVLPRKYEIFTEKGEEKCFEALKESYEKLRWFNKKMGKVDADLEAYGIPCLISGGGAHPIDFIMDFLRDFQGLLGDMRRKPQILKKACETINQFFINSNFNGSAKGDAHLIFWPIHIPTFLKPKDFKEFYLPYLNSSLDYAMNQRGHTVMMFMEGSWVQHYDILEELPDNDGKLVGLLEKGDFKEFKQKAGNKMCVCGGIPQDLLQFGTTVECEEFTKKLINEVAPGGGFVVATNMPLLSINDAKPENLKTVINIVREYGKY